MNNIKIIVDFLIFSFQLKAAFFWYQYRTDRKASYLFVSRLMNILLHSINTCCVLLILLIINIININQSYWEENKRRNSRNLEVIIYCIKCYRQKIRAKLIYTFKIMMVYKENICIELGLKIKYHISYSIYSYCEIT